MAGSNITCRRRSRSERRAVIARTTNHCRNSFVALAKQKDLRPPEETSYTFHSLLFTHGMNLCSDPRDRVFALLALAQDVDTAQIRYEMTAQDLYFQILLQVAPDSGQMIELAEYLLPVLELNVLPMVLELPDYAARARNVVFACSGTARGKHNSSDVWIASWLHDFLQLRGGNTADEQQNAWEQFKSTLRLYMSSDDMDVGLAKTLLHALGLDAHGRRCLVDV